jgi:N-acetylglucosaminyldiphosphoundecaprenol N-acetyl-beta-D-mannosaminyltransferase
LGEFCATNLNNPNVVGVFSPPFRILTDEEMASLARQITDSGAHIVWIGLSTPKQEAFASRLASFMKVHFFITVGAAFDFHTGRLKQAPKIMQNAGLEWFFRLLIEPRRLYKRYFTIVPMFIYLNIKEFLHFYISKRTDK